MNWKLFGLVGVGAFLVLIAGCGLLDTYAGVDEFGNDLPGPSPAETTAPLLSLIPGFGPILASAVGALTTAYAAARGGRYKKAATATFEGVESYFKANPEHEKAFKEFLASHHTAAGVYDLVKGIVSKYDH